MKAEAFAERAASRAASFIDAMRDAASTISGNARLVGLGFGALGVGAGLPVGAYALSSAGNAQTAGDTAGEHMCDPSSVKVKKHEEYACMDPAGLLLQNGQRIKIYANVARGSGDYEFRWKLGGRVVGRSKTYTFKAENTSSSIVSDKLAVVVKDYKTHKVMKPWIMVDVVPQTQKGGSTTSITNNTTTTVIAVTVAPQTTTTTTPTSTTTTSTTPPPPPPPPPPPITVSN